MKKNKLFLIASIILTSSVCSNAALSIVSTNNVGFDSNSSAVVDNAGNVIAQNSGFIGVGTFGSLSDAAIQALGSGTDIDSSFSAVGSTNFNLVDGIWEATIEDTGDTSAFVGQNIFTVIGNGSTLADSTQFLIYRHEDVNTTGTFNEQPSLNDAASVAEGTFSSGRLLVGGHGNFQHDFGAGSSDAFNLVVVVPEPSSMALLGLGSFALILRRRR